MIVVYVSFDVEPDRQAAFEGWFPGLTEQIRGLPGCIAYDYLLDPTEPRRRTMVEAYETSAAHVAHLAHPAYQEILRRGTSEFGMRNIRAHKWSEADCYSFIVSDGFGAERRTFAQPPAR